MNWRTTQRKKRTLSARSFATVVAGLVAYATFGGTAQAQLKGDVKVDGSSTVAPITMAAAELYQAEQPRVRVTVGISGTGGGFKKFLADRADLRTDISDASRPIKGKEIARAKELGIEYIEVPIGIDGIAVVINPKNDFCDSLTVDELKKIWEPGSAITSWKDIRPSFPDIPLKLYGPDTDSGTFDYFTEAIVGESRSSRSDYTASASDNVLVQGVAGDKGALGYFGFSYYEANKDKLGLVAVDNNVGKPIKPSLDVIRSGAYKPLSRPMFIYVNKESFTRPEVKSFVTFLLKNARSIVEHPRVNYVAYSNKLYQMGMSRLEAGKTGSVMAAAQMHGEPTSDMEQLYGSH